MLNRPVTGVILAGGQNKRFDRRQKTFFTIGERSIFQRIYDVMRSVFDQVVIVTNTPQMYLSWNADITTDVLPRRSSLTGIHAGLFFIRTPHAFFAACDIPFLKKEIVEAVVANAASNIDVVVPETANGFEPLCAVYSKRSLGIIEETLAGGKFTIRSVYDRLNVKTIGEEILRHHDPALESFMNVNTREELERARKWYADKQHII